MSISVFTLSCPFSLSPSQPQPPLPQCHHPARKESWTPSGSALFFNAEFLFFVGLDALTAPRAKV